MTQETTTKTQRQRRKLSPKELARRERENAAKRAKEQQAKILAATPDRMVERCERDGVRLEIWKCPATGKFRVVAHAEIGTATLAENLTLADARKGAGIVYNPPVKETKSSEECWREVSSQRK